MLEGKSYKGRVYKRKFDHDEARYFYARGSTIKQLAEKYGVSTARINQVVNPEVGRRADEAASAYRWLCADCGAPTQHKGSRCRECANKLRATSVREGELWCFHCRTWKPDQDFPKNRQATARRGHHGICRVCSTEVRRDHRHRNREAENAYQRAYKRKRRWEKMTPLQRATSRLGPPEGV